MFSQLFTRILLWKIWRELWGIFVHPQNKELKQLKHFGAFVDIRLSKMFFWCQLGDLDCLAQGPKLQDFPLHR